MPSSDDINNAVDSLIENEAFIDSYVESDDQTDVTTPDGTSIPSLQKRDRQLAETGHVGDVTNPHNVTKAQVGLSNADNTADADKPVSAAQQAAIDAESQARQTADEGKVDLNASNLQNAAITLSKLAPDVTALLGSGFDPALGQGDWNPTTDTPTIPAAGTAGNWYRVSVAGTASGTNADGTYEVDDLVVDNGTSWNLFRFPSSNIPSQYITLGMLSLALQALLPEEKDLAFLGSEQPDFYIRYKDSSKIAFQVIEGIVKSRMNIGVQGDYLSVQHKPDGSGTDIVGSFPDLSTATAIEYRPVWVYHNNAMHQMAVHVRSTDDKLIFGVSVDGVIIWPEVSQVEPDPEPEYELYFDERLGLWFPTQGDTLMLTGIHDSIFESTEAASGQRGLSILEGYLENSKVISAGVGGLNSKQLLKLVEGHSMHYPISTDSLTNGNTYTFRTKQNKTGREFGDGLTDTYRSEWLARACQLDEMLMAVWFDGEGNRLGYSTQEDYKVATTDYATNSNRIYIDNSDGAIVDGMEVTFDSPDLSILKQDITRHEPTDEIGPSANGNYTRQGFPIDLVYRKTYAVTNATATYIELKEWPSQSGSIDIGSDATVELHMRYGFSLSHTYTGTTGTGHGINVEIITYRGYHSGNVFVETSANDATSNDWADMIDNTKEILKHFHVRDKGVCVVIPSLGSYGTGSVDRTPGGANWQAWYDARRELQFAFPNNHIDLQAELNSKIARLQTELDLLADPPNWERITTLGGTPEAPNTSGSTNRFVGAYDVTEKKQNGLMQTVDLGPFPLQLSGSVGDAIHWDKNKGGVADVPIFRDTIAQFFVDKGWFKQNW